MMSCGIYTKIKLEDDLLSSSSDSYSLEYEEKFSLPFVPFDDDSFLPFHLHQDSFLMELPTSLPVKCTDDEQSSPIDNIPIRPFPRLKLSAGIGAKLLTRLHALWLLYTEYLPVLRPNNITEIKWSELQHQKAQGTLTRIIKRTDGLFVVEVDSKQDIICRIISLHAKESALEWLHDEDYIKTHLRWWSDSPIFKPTGTRRVKSSAKHIRTITLPIELSASKHFNALDDRAALRAVAFLCKILMEKTIVPADFHPYLQGRLAKQARRSSTNAPLNEIISEATEKLITLLAEGSPFTPLI